MNDIILKENDVNDRINLLEKNIRKKTFFDIVLQGLAIFFPFIILIFIFLISVTLAYFLHKDSTSIGQQLFNLVGNSYYLFLALPILYSLIAFIISTFIAFKRTHYKGFLLESINELEFLITFLLLLIFFILKILFIFVPLLIGFEKDAFVIIMKQLVLNKLIWVII